jgi:tetratricopeptide (TPR) repeat protein
MATAAHPWLIAAFALACAVLSSAVATDRFLVGERAASRIGYGLGRDWFPIEAVDFLEREELEGNVFTTWNTGSYVAWRSHPRRKPFIDSESDPWDSDHFARYMKLLRGQLPYDRVMQMYGIDYALVNYEAPSETQFFTTLARDPEWALAYLDDLAAVLVRRRGRFSRKADALDLRLVDADTLWPLPDGVDDGGRPGWRVGPAFDAASARLRLGRIFGRMGLPRRSVVELRAALARWPDFPEAACELGLALGAAGDLRGAEAVLRRAVEETPSRADLVHALGATLVRGERFAEALPCFARAWELEPAHGAYARDLGEAYALLDRVEEAREMYEAALRLSPGDPISHRRLHLIYGELLKDPVRAGAHAPGASGVPGAR